MVHDRTGRGHAQLRPDQDQVPGHSGQIRSVKDGGNRRILPEYVDEYIRRGTRRQSA